MFRHRTMKAKIMKIEIDVPDTLEFTRAGVDMVVTLDVLNPDILGQLVLHGLVQKVGDAAAGAKKAIEELAKAPGGTTMTQATWAQTAMHKVVDALYAGDWGSARGVGLTSLDLEMIGLVRKTVAGIDKAAYKDADETKRRVMCREYLETLNTKQLDTITTMAQGRVDQKVQDAKAAWEIAAMLRIDVEVNF